MTENARPSRFRFRLRTILVVVAFAALLLVVVTQQVQIARQQARISQMQKVNDSVTRVLVNLQQLQISQIKQGMESIAESNTKLTTTMREQRDLLERLRQQHDQSRNP